MIFCGFKKTWSTKIESRQMSQTKQNPLERARPRSWEPAALPNDEDTKNDVKKEKEKVGLPISSAAACCGKPNIQSIPTICQLAGSRINIGRTFSSYHVHSAIPRPPNKKKRIERRRIQICRRLYSFHRIRNDSSLCGRLLLGRIVHIGCGHPPPFQRVWQKTGTRSVSGTNSAEQNSNSNGLHACIT